MASIWTDGRIEQLRHLWASGDSASVIGSAMGLTRCAVLGKAHRLRLASRIDLSGGAPQPFRRTKNREPAKRVHRDSVFKSGAEIKPIFRVPNPNKRPPLIAVTSVMTGAFLNVKRGLVRQPEYTKDQLREQLAQAMLNTARLA